MTETIKKNLRDALKKQFLLMLDEINKFHDLPFKVNLGLTFTIPEMQKSNPERMMEKFIKYVLPYEKEIEKRQNSFFVDNKDMFFHLAEKEDVGGSPMDREYVDTLTELWASNMMTPQRREAIFNFFTIFIELIKAYKKNI